MKQPAQLIFYALTEAELFDHSLIADGLRRIAEKGFDGVYLEYRNSKAGIEAARFTEGLQFFREEAECCGLAVIADASVNQFDGVLRREQPEAYVDALHALRLPVRGGCFEWTASGEVLHQSIERVWSVRFAGEVIVAMEDVTDRLTAVRTVSEGGGCAMTEKRGRAMSRRVYRIAGASEGEVIVVLRRRFDYAFKDFGHPAVQATAREAARFFAPFATHGVVWDEPHFGFAFFDADGRAVSDRLLERFAERFDYRLEDRYPDLWWDQEASGRAARTRLDYAELLESELAATETVFAEAARSIFEKERGQADWLHGIHRTMHEELSDDFLIGCCDYFRHDQFTHGAFTDSVFERPDSMLAMAHLARSMAHGKPGQVAWSNSWGFEPTPQQQSFYLHMLGAMQVRWIGHAFRSSVMFGPGFPNHPCWETMAENLAAHRGLLHALEGAKPVFEATLVYNWRAIAGVTGAERNTHRRSLLLAAWHLTEAGVPFRIAPPEALGDEINAGAIWLPWAEFLPESAWRALEAAAAEGRQLTIWGPPPTETLEGESVGERFQRLCGLHEQPDARHFPMGAGEIVFESVAESARPEEITPNFMNNPKESYPVGERIWLCQPGEGADAAASHAAGAVGVARTSAAYFGYEWPFYPRHGVQICSESKSPPGVWSFPYQSPAGRLQSVVPRDPAAAAAFWSSLGLPAETQAAVYAPDSGEVRFQG